MRKKNILLTFSFLCCSCLVFGIKGIAIAPSISGEEEWVRKTFTSLSPDERIAQLFMVACYANGNEKHEKEIEGYITKNKIGGIMFLRGTPVRQALLTNHYQSLSSVPLLVAMDAEWGSSMRLDSAIKYPRHMMLGAVSDNRLIYDMAVAIAYELKALGVHMNFAPVADINTNPQNPVINSRSFGENADAVARKSLAYVRGLQDNGIIATAKHFPGHGDTDTDSHVALPVLKHSRERLDSHELVPFKMLIDSGVQAVMVGHLHIPVIDSTPNMATSLSSRLVQDILINRMNFSGLVITDALQMKGVTGYVDKGEIEARALNAGNDILLMPSDLDKAIQAIKREIKKGNITQEEIDKHCLKILRAKYRVGLNDYSPVNIKNVEVVLQSAQSKALRRKLVQAAVTVVTNTDNILPLHNLESLKIASVSIGADNTTVFQEMLSLYAEVTHFKISKNALPVEISNLISHLAGFDLIIVGIHNTNEFAERRYGITEQMTALVDTLSTMCPVVLDVFGNPYILNNFTNISRISAVLVSYEDSEVAQDISAQIIFGGKAAQGHLPVTVGMFAQGTGIEISKTRLGYSMPEELGIAGELFGPIDTIIAKAIRANAMPGCQLLIAKNAEVIYHQAYGYHTYLNRRAVTKNDIYDIASITKIVSTTALLMKCFEQKKINFDDRLSVYLPFLDTTNKKKITIKDVLTHQAGLFPYIPFYMGMIEPLNNAEELISKEMSDKYPYKIDKKKYLNKNYVFKEGIFSSEQSAEYSVQVAENLFMRYDYVDTIYKIINESEVKSKREYKYSDLGYYYFMRILESIYGSRLHILAADSFYRPLGAVTTGYLPFLRFPKERIVPTENDQVFRKQILQGYVHDPGAAMLGGVSGHAGVFSNANDLAKIMQMFLNGGSYGGRKYIDSATLAYFTSCQFCKQDNRRGLGFDKPEPNEKKDGPTARSASLTSYGHTGFTGTIAWVDPEWQLVYIFLSNRIHPDQDNDKLIRMNIRTAIQQKIYDAITTTK